MTLLVLKYYDNITAYHLCPLVANNTSSVKVSHLRVTNILLQFDNEMQGVF